MALVTISVRPDTVVRLHDFEGRDGRIAGLALDGATIHLMSERGETTDADIITSGLILATAVMELVEAARERMRVAAGLPPMPDGLDAASMAEALSGWTESELAGAWGK